MSAASYQWPGRLRWRGGFLQRPPIVGHPLAVALGHALVLARELLEAGVEVGDEHGGLRSGANNHKGKLAAAAAVGRGGGKGKKGGEDEPGESRWLTTVQEQGKGARVAPVDDSKPVAIACGTSRSACRHPRPLLSPCNAPQCRCCRAASFCVLWHCGAEQREARGQVGLRALVSAQCQHCSGRRLRSPPFGAIAPPVLRLSARAYTRMGG